MGKTNSYNGLVFLLSTATLAVVYGQDGVAADNSLIEPMMNIMMEYLKNVTEAISNLAIKVDALSDDTADQSLMLQDLKNTTYHQFRLQNPKSNYPGYTALHYEEYRSCVYDHDLDLYDYDLDRGILRGSQSKETSEDDCKKKCDENNKCNFFYYMPAKGNCELYTKCDRFRHVTGISNIFKANDADAVIKAIETCEKWDADGRDKRPSEYWKVTEITQGAIICLKFHSPSRAELERSRWYRIYRKRNDAFCFTKKDLPPNAVFPGSPEAPSSNLGSGKGSENGGEDVHKLSVKTHSGVFDWDRFLGDSPEKWATSNLDINYTCDFARLIVWKDGGNEFGKLRQVMYKNITVSTKAGKYYGLRSVCEFGVDFPLCGDET